MDLLSAKWLSEMEEMSSDSAALIHEWQHMNSLGDDHNNNLEDSFDYKPQLLLSASSSSLNNIISHHQQQQQIVVVEQKKLQQQRPPPPPWKLSIGGAAAENASSSSSSTIISFANSDSPRTTTNTSSGSGYFNKNAKSLYINLSDDNNEILHHHQNGDSRGSIVDQLDSFEFGHQVNNKSSSSRGTSRTAAQAQDHVLAERKRREKMTQKFVALSALIPGLTKLDKATVLGDAIKYIKELQERVRGLEVEVMRNNNDNGETTIKVPVKRCRLLSGGHDENASSSSDENFDYSGSRGGGGGEEQAAPEIEVRASSEGNVLVRVYCKNQSGVIKGVLGEIEKHHLTVVSSSAMPFGDNRLHITIVAQVEIGEPYVTAKNLADHLRTAILNLV